MELISHRGNTVGINPTSENTTAYINDALSEGYAVVVDVWLLDNRLYLCSEHPSLESPTSRSRGYKAGPLQERTNEEYLENDMILVRARTPETLIRLFKNSDIHCFSLEGDMAITSRGYVITRTPAPGENVICINPGSAPDCYGVCSDEIKNYGRPDVDAVTTISSRLKSLSDKSGQVSLLEDKQEELSTFIESTSTDVLGMLEAIASSDSKNLKNNNSEAPLLEARRMELDSLIGSTSLEIQNSIRDLHTLRDSFTAILATIEKMLEE